MRRLCVCRVCLRACERMVKDVKSDVGEVEKPLNHQHNGLQLDPHHSLLNPTVETLQIDGVPSTASWELFDASLVVGIDRFLAVEKSLIETKSTWLSQCASADEASWIRRCSIVSSNRLCSQHTHTHHGTRVCTGYFQNLIFGIIWNWFFTPKLDVLLLALWRSGEQSLRTAQDQSSFIGCDFLLGTKNLKMNETKNQVLKVFARAAHASIQPLNKGLSNYNSWLSEGEVQ